MRRNSDVESFQEVFDPESLIQRENRLPRLVKILSFPTNSAISVGDIFGRCNEECGLILSITKSKSSLSDLELDTSAFEFPRIAWSPLAPESPVRVLPYLPESECLTFATDQSL